MTFELIDTFTGAVNTALVGHTPNTGTVWSGSASFMYPGSDIKLTGDGYAFNNSNTISGTSSLIITPTTISGSTHVTYASWKFLTNITANNQSLSLYSPGDAAADNRLVWTNGDWNLSLLGSVVATEAFAMPSTGTVIITRVTAIDGVSILCETSADYGVTWASLFSGAVAFTNTANPFKPGIWYDGLNTPTTGVLVGNLREGTTGTTPTLAVSPTTYTVSTSGTLTLTGTGTNWNAGTPGAPTFTVTGGTGASVSGQVVAGVNSTTLTLAPGSAAGTLTIHDPSGGTATVTVSASTATAFTLTGPSTGTVGVASSNFTFTPTGGAYTGTITPTMSGLAGTWSPTTLTYASSSAAQTATFTASAAGNGNANGTTSPSLTPPSNIAYAASVAPTGTDYWSFIYNTGGVTPTFAVKTATGTTPTYSGGTPVSQGTGAYTAKFTAVEGNYIGLWTVSGTITEDPARVTGVAGTYLCILDEVDPAVTPTFTLRDMTGGTVGVTSGGTPVNQGTGAWSVLFGKPAGLVVGRWSAAGTIALDAPFQPNSTGGGGGNTVNVTNLIDLGLPPEVAAQLGALTGDITQDTLFLMGLGVSAELAYELASTV